jgi:hypothetical protein
VQRGILTQDQATALIKQADDEAATARAAAATPAARPPATAAPSAVAGSPSAPAPDGSVRVTYVPEVVKKQLREEIKQEVMAQAKEERWAAPNQVPDWASRINIYGDFRGRYEADLFPHGNDNTGGLPNFNAINTGTPFDTTGANFPPQNNVDQDRHRFRLRARLGVDANLGEGFSTAFRIGSGENNSPVSQNQTLGLAGSSQGGNFSKYQVWIDRAFLNYQPWNETDRALALTVGRFDNPFFATNLLWADDLAFDGFVASGKYMVAPDVTPFITAGAFPVLNTDFNFASNQPAKFKSHDKWLFGAQVGTDWRIARDYALKFGVAYYDFHSIEGKVADCVVLSAADICPTDATRPSFAQNGNTYMPLRNIVPTAANGFGTINQFQFFGLATPYREVALTSRLDFSRFDPVHVALTGEFVKNVAFNKSLVAQRAVNNRGPLPDQKYDGGDSGYHVNMIVGNPLLQQRWDWNVSLGYKYLESDAVVDAFTDSDFGLGGTNLKGYILGGQLALAQNVWTRLRWMSSDNIAGPTFKVDIVQLDLNARF